MVLLRKVTTVVTGVAGSPYYVSGYFLAATGTATNCIRGWHAFVTGDSATARISGSRWDTGPLVDLIDSATGDLQDRETGTADGFTGLSTAATLPMANQYLVRWRTGQFAGGRELTGHTNIPIVLQSDSTDRGVLTPAAQTALTTRATSMINDVNTTFVIWSRKNGTAATVTTATVPTKFAILRSRRD
jgi:hypothetical protein